MNDDVDFNAGLLHSSVEYTPDTSDVYVIRAGAYINNPNRDPIGHYEVRVYTEDDFMGRTLTGTEGSDVFLNDMAGGPGNDALDGRGGNDILDDLILQQQESDLIIDLSDHGGGILILAGVNESDLADTHFIFFIEDA